MGRPTWKDATGGDVILSQQGQVTQTVPARGRRGRLKLPHKHAGQHHHCKSPLFWKAFAHTWTYRFMSPRSYQLPTIYYTNTYVKYCKKLSSHLQKEKNNFATLHTESRSILCIPEKGKQALIPATTYPVSWSQLFL